MINIIKEFLCLSDTLYIYIGIRNCQSHIYDQHALTTLWCHILVCNQKELSECFRKHSGHMKLKWQGKKKSVYKLAKKHQHRCSTMCTSPPSLCSSVPISSIQFSSHLHFQLFPVSSQPNMQLQNGTKFQQCKIVTFLNLTHQFPSYQPISVMSTLIIIPLPLISPSSPIPRDLLNNIL